jgi:YD repeat-containing protein
MIESFEIKTADGNVAVAFNHNDATITIGVSDGPYAAAADITTQQACDLADYLVGITMRQNTEEKT